MTPDPLGLNLLSHVLGAAGLRHRVIAQNIANVNTPGYRRLEVTFEEDLARALQTPGCDRPAREPAAPRCDALHAAAPPHDVKNETGMVKLPSGAQSVGLT